MKVSNIDLTMRTLIKLVTSVLATLAFLGFANFAFAQTKLETRVNASAPSAAKALVRCEEVTRRITERIAKWDQNEPKKHEAYLNVITRIRNLIANLDSTTDTTALRTALENLNQAILKRHLDAGKVISDLRISQQFACGESQGQFRTTVNQAKTDFALVKEDTRNIRSIWLNQVRPALRSLKVQRPKTSASPSVRTNILETKQK